MSAAQILLAGYANPEPPATYAVWDSGLIGSGYALSGGDLVVTRSGADGWSTVVGTVGKSAGKWYWEYTATTMTYLSPMFGVGRGTVPLENFIGFSLAGWGYSDTELSYNDNTSTSYGNQVFQGDVIGIALDMDAGTVSIYQNGVDKGVMYSGLTGKIYPAISMHESGDVLTANFGQSAFAYTPPVGFNAGLWTTQPSMETWSTTPGFNAYSGFALSNGNLTATLASDPGQWVGIRGTLAMTSGFNAFEVTFSGASGYVCTGVSDGTADYTSAGVSGLVAYSETSGGGWFNATNSTIRNGVQIGYLHQYVMGDVVGVVLDMSAGTLTFYKNGVLQDIAYITLLTSGTFYPAASIYASTGSVTGNFGPSLAYTYP